MSIQLLSLTGRMLGWHMFVKTAAAFAAGARWPCLTLLHQFNRTRRLFWLLKAARTGFNFGKAQHCHSHQEQKMMSTYWDVHTVDEMECRLSR